MYVLNTNKEIVHVDINIFTNSCDFHKFLWKQKYNIFFTSNTLELMRKNQNDSSNEQYNE